MDQTIIQNIPNFITLLNLQFGFIGLICCLNNNYSYYYVCFILSLLCDFLDGKSARYLKVSSEIGAQLDSLSDMVSFVFIPCFLGYHRYDLIIPNSIYLLCGCYRLARFNVSHTNTDFEGIPTVLASIIVVVFMFYEFDISYIRILYLLVSYLMVSKIKVLKI